jgi:hypothetical protein
VLFGARHSLPHGEEVGWHADFPPGRGCALSGVHAVAIAVGLLFADGVVAVGWGATVWEAIMSWWKKALLSLAKTAAPYIGEAIVKIAEKQLAKKSITPIK